MPWLRFILVLLACGALALLAAAWLMARLLLHPPRYTDARAAWLLKRLSPGDLGLAFEPMDFPVRSASAGNVDLAAWWIPNPAAAGRCILLIHGFGSTKVVAIGWAPLLHALGWNILALDLRGHGASGGKRIGGAPVEAEDVIQVIDQLRAGAAQTRQLVLMGLSYGGVVAAAAAAARDDLRGVILDSPPLELSEAAMAHFDKAGLPGRPAQSLALRIASMMMHREWSETKPVQLIERIACPLMLITCGQDRFVKPARLVELKTALARRQATGKKTTYWHLPDTHHMGARESRSPEYARRIAEFLAAL